MTARTDDPVANVCFSVEVDPRDRSAADRVSAEAWAGGAVGIEERGEQGEIIVVHAPAELGEAIAAECARVGGVAHVGGVSAVPDVRWSEAWKEGLDAIVVSPRLVVRPPFVPVELGPGQREVVIDPGQAFGTGQHQSTRLVLGWIDRIVSAWPDAPARRVLDVGTGSGVLALAALELGAGRALAFDLDPAATAAAEQAARDNGHARDCEIRTAGIECAAGERYDLVLANLLRSEMLPIASELAAATAAGGWLVLAGLLDSDEPLIAEVFAREGLTIRERSEEADADGARWVGLVLRAG